MPAVHFRLALSVMLLAAGPTLAQAPPLTGKPRVDRFGDALPPGALFRIGTTRLRLGEQSATVVPTPDGKYVAAIRSGEVVLWDAATGKDVRRIHAADLTGFVAFTRDGKSIVVNDSKNLILFDLATEKFRQAMGGTASCAVCAPDGKTLAAVQWENNGPFAMLVSRWDLATGMRVAKWEYRFELPTGDDNVRLQVNYWLSGDGQTLATVEHDLNKQKQMVRLHDVARGAELRRWAVSAPMVAELAFRPDGKLLAASSEEGTIRVWETATGKEASRWKADVGKVPLHSQANVAFAPDGASLFYSVPAGLVRADWRTGKPLQTYADTWGPLAFFPGGKIMAGRGPQFSVRLLDIATGRDLCPLPRLGNHLAFAPDGRRLAWSEGSAVVVADAVTGTEVRRWQAHMDAGRPLAIAPDGKTLATAGRDGRIRLWEIASGQQIRSMMAKRPMDRLFFAPDGRRLASSHLGALYLWDVASGTQLGQWSGDPDVVMAANLQTVAITDRKAGLIRLLDLPTGNETRALHGYRDSNQFAIRFSDDDGFLRGGFDRFRPKLSPNGRLLIAAGRTVANSNR